MILGQPEPIPGSDMWGVSNRTISVDEVGVGLLARDFVVGAVLLYARGTLAGSGQQSIRGAVASLENADETLAVGDEVIVTEDTTLGWLWLPFSNPVRLQQATTPLAGMWGGPAGGLTGVEGIADNVGGRSWLTADYSSIGPPVILDAFPSAGLRWRALLIGVEPWQAPNVSDDELVSATPLGVASDYFAAAGSPGEPLAANAGWRYDQDAPPPPGTCVVRTGGPLQDLVGDRITITALTTYGEQSISLYVIDEQPFDDELAAEDLALSRAAFARLAPLSTDLLSVTVQVLGGS